MKIGLMAFHYAINFGATLQLLSTYKYLVGKGYNPVIINWIPDDVEAYYAKVAPESQRRQQLAVRQWLWKETPLCRTSLDVAKVIESEGVDAVIIGSDAVCQCHTFMERIAFPCRTVIGVNGVLTSGMFPNAFWADWTDFMKSPVPVAVISASSQDSKYSYFLGKMRKEMEKRVMSYRYLSVRDEWTRRMMIHITRGKRQPEVTPDPVFAFSQNASDVLPSRDDIIRRFDLPEKYIVLSFINDKIVSQEWLEQFSRIARERDGVECVMLPFAHRNSSGHLKKEILLPLSPVDWYSLIRFSQGYVGNNMHPIVVSLHNNVPFFSFDNYGLNRFNGLLPTDKSSKILHILTLAGLEGQRVSCLSKVFRAPKPEVVYDKLKATDLQKMRSFAVGYLEQYNKMMDEALSSLTP